MPTAVRPAENTRTTRAEVPRWANRAAHLVGLCILPSCIWRTVALFTLTENHGREASQAVYMLVLTLGSEALGLLTLGLVRPWGERVPRWIPVLGGRGLSTRLVVGIASTGVALLTLVYLWGLVNSLWVHHHFQPVVGGAHNGTLPTHGPGLWILVACYAPLLLWAPLVAACTVAYARRRRGESTVGVAGRAYA